ncbi:ABC transporter permease subunit/CPBP intramembrane protease [Rubinisphaera sp. JC750]|uniref:ABC transporter permease subunit/CPBP intramembrane protease n=1 Tax=Rubinisphaera sp. JC750 TaxID=2898658 RepID=UPI001F026781|nr:ABC transporter permease subunit/CPBP intramembrane protease [Rubinisphaera sp. JC750]
MNEPQSNTESNAGDANDSGFWFAARQQLEFTRKELRETLRDRRTLVTLLAMPILLYPLLGLGFRFLAVQQSLSENLEYRVAVSSDAEGQWLVEVLRMGDQIVGPPPADAPQPELQLLTPNDETTFDLKTVVADTGADLGVEIEWDHSSDTGFLGTRPARVTLIQNSGSPLSRDAYDYVTERLTAANNHFIEGWARQSQQAFTIPIQQDKVLVEPPESRSAILGVLPLILLLMTVTGGVYPAIDLTAGERERNTLETLMALPVPRFRLLFAKYVAVVSVTMLTGLMNLVAMSVTVYALQLEQTLLGSGGFTLGLLGTLFLVLTAFALFYSAVLLMLTSSARSFKEAQAYLIPLLLLSIAPGLVILMPGWSLSGGTAAIPLVNILLLSRDLLESTVQPLPAIAAVVSTFLYGVAALAMAARMFGNDAVSIGSQGSWRGLFQRPTNWTLTPSVTSSFIALATLFPVYFVASGILSRGAEIAPFERLVLSGTVTTLIFLGIPLLFLWHQRVGIRSGLKLTAPRWVAVPGALLLGFSTWPMVFELLMLAQDWGIRGIDPEQLENVEQLLAGWKSVPTWLVLLTLGVVPGVCEECFFRGYLFNGLRDHFKPLGTILITAVAFGLFHVVLAGGAAPERLLPSTLMGILLGWVRLRSGSLLPSILLHVVHNSSLLLVVQSRDLLEQWNIGQFQQQHLPATWLAAAAVGFAISLLLIHYSQRGTQLPANPQV